jgi:hypothetical protein
VVGFRTCLLGVAFSIGVASVGYCESDSYAAQLESFSELLTEFAVGASARPAGRQCAEEYAALFGHETLDISVFFGAMDTADGHLLDRAAKDALVAHLTGECPANYHACGFVAAGPAADPETTRLERDAGGQKIALELYGSSLSEHVEQLASVQPRQEQRSKRIRERFLDAVQQDDVILYVGHSRFGTGPSFHYISPLSRRWFATYSTAPTLTAMLERLEQATAPPKMLGLFSCSSERYYAKRVHSAAPKTALLVTNGLALFDALVLQATNMLNAIIGRECYVAQRDERRVAGTAAHYVLYGLPAAAGFPYFDSRHSLRGVVLYLLCVPLIVLGASRFSALQFPEPIVTRTYVRDLLLVILLPIVGIIVAQMGHHFDTPLGPHAIPLLIIVSGLFLLARFARHRETLWLATEKTLRVCVVPLGVSVAILFLPEFISDPGLEPLLSLATKVVKFVGFFVALLPFTLLSGEILMYPLRHDAHVHFAVRAGVFLLTSTCLYLVLAFALVNLNIQIWPYKEALFGFFLFMQLTSLLVYRLKQSIPLCTAVQTLSLSFVLSEGLHSIFY